VIGQLEFGEEDRADALQRVWSLCLTLLESKVPVVTFQSFIRPIQPLSYEDKNIVLGVVSAYSRDWLQRNATNAIRSALEFHLDTQGLQIQIVVQSKEAQRTNDANRKPRPTQHELPLDEVEEVAPTEFVEPVKAPKPPTPGRAKSKNEPKQPEQLPIPSLTLNERYTFSSFLIGRSNRLAHAGALQVASKPGSVYNPLFLYGGPGLGKTHLLQAIAHSISATNPHARIAYISGEYFAQHYISALREHDTETFRKQYRMVDVWLVDDIQFIAGKEHTKEEFFHTFNALYQSGKQIVIASDRSPRELNTMDERLRSRFQSGLIADIGAPDLETRIAILQKCRQRDNAEIPDEVITYIASAIQSNIRALEGALTKLLAYSSIMNLPVRAELAQEVLSEYFIEKPLPMRKVTVQEIVRRVGEEFGVTQEAIMGPNRNKDVSQARQIAIYLCRETLPELSTTVTGAHFGGRDHATVVYACQKVRSMRAVDPELNGVLTRLYRELMG
jgi:chromosomal replication initiator protein